MSKETEEQLYTQHHEDQMDIFTYLEEMDELDKEIQEETEEFNSKIKDVNDEMKEEIKNHYNTEDINDIISVKAKVKRIEEQIDYFENYDEDKEYPNYIANYGDPRSMNVDTNKLKDIQQQIKDSYEMKDLVENIKYNRVNASEDRIRSLNKKINNKLMNQANIYDREPMYIDLLDVYESLKMINMDGNNYSKKLIIFTCGLGQYILKHCKEKPYYVSNIAENIINIGKWGSNLDQNTDIIQTLNSMTKNL